jgi:hypothetical protein
VTSEWITPRSPGVCADCQQSTPQDPKKLVQIGKTVHVSGLYVSTTHTFYQCPECGQIWHREVDRGRGGHDSGWRRLTSDY